MGDAEGEEDSPHEKCDELEATENRLSGSVRIR